MDLTVIILAAGKGKRMSSSLPKVMHQLAGVPLLERVVTTAKKLTPTQIHVVYGNCRGALREHFLHLGVSWVDQKEQCGTGHAVMQVMPKINLEGQVLVLYGDVPAVTSDTLQALLNSTSPNSLGILTTKVESPQGLGRIIRDQHGRITKIVEHKDATERERTINEINTGIICCSAKLLHQWLPQLKPHNKQGEYYLTDIVSLAAANQIEVHSMEAATEEEVQGVNDLWQLVELERKFQLSQAKKFALKGVRVMDPGRLDIRGYEVLVGQDTTLDIGVILEGPLSIGKNCTIGANCIIKDSVIGDNVEILPNSILEGVKIEDKCTIGPFARLRPGTYLASQCKVGNFVEIKKSHLGLGSKASHLSYLGDATIGESVNIGAGTITCNYDGVNKWQTVIKDGAFIGSNTSLVAPVVIGEKATIGAGSTINRAAPDFQLTVGRARQVSISNWQRPQKNTNEVLED